MQAGCEIKYQAWLHEEKEMVDVAAIDLLEKRIEYYDLSSCQNDAEKFEVLRGAPNADCPFERCTLRRYTGLLDKNGKEIYESDILLESLSFDEKYAHVVVWSQDDCAWMFEYDGDLFTASEMNFEQCEIVGNVYDKPELLEVVNDASRT
ncbi:YopX family protein [Brevibacillus massiliensis]|uniref:YopX family protein n=1 Tax=Brevibacillus massiliensis TaxID=1118054 RepID=UPI0002F9F16A|nr:YopX family protein [Brevibacillus massiliensis]